MINALGPAPASVAPPARPAAPPAAPEDQAHAGSFARLLGQASERSADGAPSPSAGASGPTATGASPEREAVPDEAAAAPAMAGADTGAARQAGRKSQANAAAERKAVARPAARGTAEATGTAVADAPAAEAALATETSETAPSAVNKSKARAPGTDDAATAPGPQPTAQALLVAIAAHSASGGRGSHAAPAANAGRASAAAASTAEAAALRQPVVDTTSTGRQAPEASAFADALTHFTPESRAEARPEAAQAQPTAPATFALAANGTGTQASPAEAMLTARPGSEAFTAQFGAQITTFVRDGVEHARLHLHPAELGPVSVQIQIDGAQAQVHLAAEHPLTRQALEQAMPQLAGSLREAGLTLAGGGVFEQARQGGDAPGSDTGGRRERATSGANGIDGGAAASETRPAATTSRSRRGVVDLVA